ncbi:kinesin, putative, partial [Bodo saltans]
MIFSPLDCAIIFKEKATHAHTYMLTKELIRNARRSSLAGTPYLEELPANQPADLQSRNSNRGGGRGEQVRVAVRVRPRNGNELRQGAQCVVVMNPSANEVRLQGESKPFSVDLPLWCASGDQQAEDGSAPIDQDQIYMKIGRPLLTHALLGFNSTILAYGQTGSGKTHTMMGNLDDTGGVAAGSEGIIPRLCMEMFDAIDKASANRRSAPPAELELTASAPFANPFGIPFPKNQTEFPTTSLAHHTPVAEEQFTWKARVMYFELYCEKITDLLCPKNVVTLREMKEGLSLVDENVHQSGGSSCGAFNVVGATRVPVENWKQVLQLLQLGNRHRRTACTKLNDRSSRSHAIFNIELEETLTILQVDGTSVTAHSKTVSIKLVDLAGSERVNESGVTGQNLKEAASINKSLFTLGQVIDALSANNNNTNNADGKILIPRRNSASSGCGSTSSYLLPPYRESLLTKLLRNSFGGNSKTTLIATVSPTQWHKQQTLQTLQYAARARRIVNTPKVVEDPAAADLRTAQQELLDVRQQLEDARKVGDTVARDLVERLHYSEEMMRRQQQENTRLADDIARREADLQRQLRQAISTEQSYQDEMDAMQRQLEAFRQDNEEREASLIERKAEYESETQRLLTTQLEYDAKQVALAREAADLAQRQVILSQQAQELETAHKQQLVNIARSQQAQEEQARAREAELAARQQ